MILVNAYVIINHLNFGIVSDFGFSA